jgi:hypothetical protein
MKALRDSFTIAMSSDERDELLSDISAVYTHLEGYFEQAGDVESGTEDAKLMDAMHRLGRFAASIRNAPYV